MPSPLTEIAEAPKFITPDEHQEAQQSTPGSFAAIPPVLRFKLDPVSIYIRPTPSNPPQCFASFQVQQQDQDDEGRVTTSASQGSLWLTEESLSFLSSETSSGFKLSYPAISLHAVTRSPPQGLYGPSTSSSTNASTSSSTGCLYCQLDLSSGEQDAEEEQDEDTLVEMHIFTQDDETLEQLFESLSYCASLHPSAGGDDGGNPFSGLAPFGNGLPNGSSGMALDGEYDDADEGDDDLVTDVQAQDGDQEELSEAGRAVLAHLESVMEWPSGGEGVAAQGSREAGGPIKVEKTKESMRIASTTMREGEEAEEGETGEGRPIQEEEPTNTLILSNLPAEFFVPSVCSALLSLLNAYGPMVRWTPLASAGRAVVIFERSQDAEMAKRSLDRLLLPFQEVGIGEEDTEADLTPRRAGQEEVYDESSGGGGTPFLKVVYGRFTSPTETQPSSLSVPSTDKNFLISPPGSPPVGWEPIREDPPNRDTLAEDLMRALGELRDTQSHIRSHKPRFWGCGGEEGGRGETTTRNGGGPPHPPPEVILLAVSETEEDGILPGVTVQSMDAEEEGDEGSKDGRGRTPPRFSISSVKATVESMRGPTTSTGASSGSLGGQRDEGEDGEIGGGLGWGQGGKRITPTSRPPLA